MKLSIELDFYHKDMTFFIYAALLLLYNMFLFYFKLLITQIFLHWYKILYLLIDEIYKNIHFTEKKKSKSVKYNEN